MRLIDADALPPRYCKAWNKPEKMIEEAPTVDAVPVRHGHWIIPNNDILVSCICSVCNWRGYYYEDDVSNEPFCPHCGAKMDESIDDKQN